MKQKVTSGITMTLDGFTAGNNQTFDKPFGDNFDSALLDRWMFDEPEKHKHKKEIDAILDAGTRLFEGVPNLKLEPIEISGTKVVTHIKCKVLK